MLVNAGQSYLNWGLTTLCQFLPHLRSNYDTFFDEIKNDWRNYSKDGTKIGVYNEVNYYIIQYGSS